MAVFADSNHGSSSGRIISAVADVRMGQAMRWLGVIPHTIAVYLSALFICPRLVAIWFGWVFPLIRWHTVPRAADWYISHLLLTSVAPAAVVGYVAVRSRITGALWAWVVPSVVLLYSLLTLEARSSVFAPEVSRLHYYFATVSFMPSASDFAGSDPVRVLKQMTVTAPFYAGVGYTVGAALALLLTHRDNSPVSTASASEPS